MKRCKAEVVLLFIFFIMIAGLGIPTYVTAFRLFIIETSAVAGLKNNENIINDAFFNKNMFIDIYGFVQRIMGKRVVSDSDPVRDVIKDKDGFLHYVYPEIDMTAYVKALKELKTHTDNLNIPMLYIQAPSKVQEGITEFPKYIEDYSNRNADSLLGMISEDIPIMDLRELKNEFFRTDSHWTIETAYRAYAYVIKRLQKDYPGEWGDIAITTQENNYKAVKLKNSFLGSMGNRTGRYYAGLSDFTLLYPDYETDFSVEVLQSDNNIISREGDFRDSFIYGEFMENNRYNEVYRYWLYMGENYPEVVIKNNLLHEGKRILIVKDSFALPFIPFLSLNAAEVRVLDLRSFKNPDLFSYIEDKRPDIIIVMYCPATYYHYPEVFEFGSALEKTH